MSAPNEPDPQSAGHAPPERVFLVVVDESEELKVALRYAARRVQHTGGRVALLFVIEPSDLQQWAAVETLMREEQREQAEALLHKLSAEVAKIVVTPDMKEKLGAQGADPFVNSPDQFAALIRSAPMWSTAATMMRLCTQVVPLLERVLITMSPGRVRNSVHRPLSSSGER